MVAAAMTALIPGAGPPPTRIARVFMASPSPGGALSGLGGVDEDGHVPVGVLVLQHELVALRDAVEGVGVREARVHLALGDELRHRGRLLVVGEVAALE